MSMNVYILSMIDLVVIGLIIILLSDLLMDWPNTFHTYCSKRDMRFVIDFLDLFKKMILSSTKRAWEIRGRVYFTNRDK